MAGLPRAEKDVIAGSGHLVNMEQPEEFNRHSLEFLARISLGTNYDRGPFTQLWLPFRKPNGPARMRLFCFPYAGGRCSRRATLKTQCSLYSK